MIEPYKPNVIVGRNICARRRALGYSRVKLGQMVGRDQWWVRRIEAGQDPSPDELYSLSDALKISSPEILLKANAFL
jgi:ribosome-binding protein aMBF1 (putative translation factor)